MALSALNVKTPELDKRHNEGSLPPQATLQQTSALVCSRGLFVYVGANVGVVSLNRSFLNLS